MGLTNVDSTKKRAIVLAIGGAAIVTVVAAVALLYLRGDLTPRGRREEVAARGALVMPFDLERTLHVFERRADGGLQRVVVKDPSKKEQIPLIQTHLKEEAEKFRRGDFSDPAQIHGEDMPGLAELKSAAGKIEVAYTLLPDGAQIRYTTQDPALVMALHRWFDAQVSDHGRHASNHP
jgi:hypothetical protein